MNKETIFTLLRALLTTVGTFLIGKNLFGANIDDSLWQVILGALMSVASIVWGIMTKSLGLEMWQSGIRQLFLAVGGILLASGKLSPEKLESLLGLVTAVGVFVYSLISKVKSNQLVDGTISTTQLSKTAP